MIGRNTEKINTKRVPRRILDLLQKVNRYATDMREASDDGLKSISMDLQKRARAGESLTALLPRAFALVREAALRTTGLYPFDVQVMGAIALYHGNIAEMKTGEGKTLAAAMPAYLMALTGEGVHVVTVNDYLAKVGAGDIGRIHEFLGLSVGCVLQDMDKTERKEMYARDITYVTNSELGFDYLRDNMVMYKEDRVLRGLHYAIIDEVDSILIDEARTPLIISGAKNTSNDEYDRCAKLAGKLKYGFVTHELTKADILSGVTLDDGNNDCIIDEKDKRVYLTNAGVHKVEQEFGIKNYADIKHAGLRHHMQMALQAQGLLHRNRDYIVSDGKVILIDEFTGRMLPNRQFNDGLHQALEAKEGVDIRSESQILATITYQNFFNKYEYKCGMTGTALTSADEFRDIYDLKVVVIPTNRPMIREDLPDRVFMTEHAKLEALIAEIVVTNMFGQPVLVGTTSIEESEHISELLKSYHVEHRVLNARYHEMEAEIISHAGEVGRVTIATNMAGRGTDIKLGPGAAEKGGLFVIGTQRHEAQRIDNQLRGRAGRQGDPGKSQFFVSLDDDIFRLFGSEKLLQMLQSLNVPEKDPIEHPSVLKLVKNAQKKVENIHFSVRKALLDYDAVNNDQRELIYAQRDNILNECQTAETIKKVVKAAASAIVNKNFQDGHLNKEQFALDWCVLFPKPFQVTARMAENKGRLVDAAVQSAAEQYDEHIKPFGGIDKVQAMERYVLLRCIDWNWLQHLQRLEFIRQSVSLAGYGHVNPVNVYQEKAYRAFDRMVSQLCRDVVRLLFMTHPLVT